jgi:hypothetical protein
MSDSRTFDLSSVLDETYAFIATCASAPAPDDPSARRAGCLVHCQLGQSRSAAIVTAFIMRHYGWAYERAWARVKLRRPVASNENFGEQLRAYGRRLQAQRAAGGAGAAEGEQDGLPLPESPAVFE